MVFDDLDKKILRKKKDVKAVDVKQIMQASLPQIYNALNPPVDQIAVQARLQLASARGEIKEYATNHPDRIQQQRQKFQDMLARVKSISKRVKRLR